MSFKRILSLVLVLCMVLSFFPASAFADYDEEVVEEVVEEETYAEEPVVEEYAEEPVVEEIIEEDAESFATEAAYANPVAEDDDSNQYETLQDAFDNAVGTVHLKLGIVMNATATKDVTLDCNGKQVNATIYVEDGATLTVLNGTIKAVEVSDNGCLSVEENAPVNIQSATASENESVVPGVKGGSFGEISEKLLALGYKLSGTSIVKVPAVAVDENTSPERTYYTTADDLKAALDTTTSVITLLADASYKFNSPSRSISLKLNGNKADVEPANGFYYVADTTAGDVTTYTQVRYAAKVYSINDDTSATDWYYGGVGYDDADAAVNKAMGTRDILVLCGSDASAAFGAGNELYVFEADGYTFTATPAPGYKDPVKDTKPSGYPDDVVKYSSGDLLNAKVSKDGEDKYFDHFTGADPNTCALAYANNFGGTASLLKAPAKNLKYKMVADAGKSLVIDWGTYNRENLTVEAPEGFFVNETTAGTVTTYSLVAAVAKIVYSVEGDTAWFKTFNEAAEAWATSTTLYANPITLLADIEDPFMMNPAKASTLVVNHGGFKLDVTAPEGYAVRRDGEIYVPGAKSPAYPGLDPITYKVVRTYTYSFDPDNGEEGWTTTVYADTPVEAPEDPKLEGNTFLGWFINGGTVQPEWGKPTQDLNLKAKWSVHNYRFRAYVDYEVYTVDPDSKTNLFDWTRVAYYGETITDTPEKPEQDNKIFLHWGYLNKKDLWIGGKTPTFTEVPFSFTLDETFLERAYVDPDYVDPDGTTSDGLVRIFAIWKDELYTVVFDGNGGTFVTNEAKTTDKVENKDLKVGADLVYPREDAKWPGHTFLGWEYEGTTVYTGDLPRVMPNADATYVAMWDTKTCNVTFITDKGTIVDPTTGRRTTQYTVAVPFGSEIEFPNAPVVPGYTFGGWENADSEEINRPTSITDPDCVPITFKAIYEAEKVTITLDANGGEFVSALGVKSETYEITDDTDASLVYPADPEREGYKLVGWFGSDGKEYTTDSLPKNMPAEDLTLTAAWEFKQYKFVAYSIYPDTTPQFDWTRTVKENEKITEPPLVPELDNKTFLYWGMLNREDLWIGNKTPTFTEVIFPFTFDSEFLEVAKVDEDPEGQVDGIIQIYGIWKTDTYSVTYDADGGTFERSDTHATVSSLEINDVEVGKPIAYPTAAPVRTGYQFLGWRYEGGLIQNDYVPGFMPAENQNYVAEWKLLDFTIKYINDHDETLPTSYNVEKLPLTIPEQEKEGWTFIGWTASGGINVSTPVKELVIPAETTGDINAVANWTPNVHSVTWSANNGKFASDGKDIHVNKNVSYGLHLRPINGRLLYAKATNSRVGSWLTELQSPIPCLMLISP
jgi:uncharacterized repeat protein (TIGR02543 family)